MSDSSKKKKRSTEYEREMCGSNDWEWGKRISSNFSQLPTIPIWKKNCFFFSFFCLFDLKWLGGVGNKLPSWVALMIVNANKNDSRGKNFSPNKNFLFHAGRVSQVCFMSIKQWVGHAIKNKKYLYNPKKSNHKMIQQELELALVDLYSTYSCDDVMNERAGQQ